MKKFRFLYIAAAALLFAACANEEDGIGNNGPVAATVKADISNNIKTRGTADNNSWTAGDAIGVYVTSAGNTKGTNVKYEYDNYGEFVSANPIYFRDNAEQTFSAYYPYIDDPNNDKFDEDGWLKNDWTIDYSNPSNTLLANTPGIDMLARIANGNEPNENTTSLPSTRSTATQRKGMGKLEKSSTMLRFIRSACLSEW